MKHSFIVTNALIFTSDKENLYADSMIIEDGIITWAGRKEEMPACDFPEKDMEGRRILPGFVDAHMHPMMLAEMSRQISCLPPRVRSIADLREKIREVRDRQQAGQWILGWGYDEGKLREKRSPNRYDLDQACCDAPVCVVRTCLHIRCVNSKALELAGIDRNTPDPPGGIIDRDEQGEPTGILRESARDLITKILPEKTFEDKVRELLELGKLLASQGITAIGDMGNLEPGDSFPIYEEAVRRGFPQKAAVYYMWEHFSEKPDFQIPRERFSKDRQIRAAGLKLIGDGSVSGRTAWTDRPYLGDNEAYGMPVCSDQLLESAISFCKEHGCQLSMHAMGSRAIDRIISRISQEEKWNPGPEPHLRVEHVTEPSEAALDAAAKKGFGFATQPIFLYAEIESYLANLEKERVKETYPVKRMLEKGVRVCFSTDAPATAWSSPSDPFSCVKGAVTRKAWDGTDCGQREAVDLETALQLYTRESAELAGFEHIGQLKAGYWADFIVLEQDILKLPSDEIHKTRVAETYICGERVFSGITAKER